MYIKSIINDFFDFISIDYLIQSGFYGEKYKYIQVCGFRGASAVIILLNHSKIITHPTKSHSTFQVQGVWGCTGVGTVHISSSCRSC